MKLTDYFELQNRDGGESFWLLKDERPDWLYDAIYEAHQEMVPNDWVYAEARDVCEAIDSGRFDFNGRFWEDSLHEYADARVDIYTANVFRWAADMCGTSLFADAEERAVETGVDEALCRGGIVNVLQIVQYYAIESIARTICEAYDAAREENGDDDEED